MPENTLLHVFQDNAGRWLATPDEQEAQVFVTDAFIHRDIEELSLATLHERDAHALVRARGQYYYAQDLMTGTIRGGQVY